MDILKRLDQVKGRFEELNKELENERQQFEETKRKSQQKAANIIDEQKRLQGERRLLAEMGEEEGILEVDEKGYITPIEE